MAQKSKSRQSVARVREQNGELRQEILRLNGELRRLAATDWAEKGRAAIAEAAKLQDENEQLLAQVNRVQALEAAGATGGKVWAALRISRGEPVVELFSSRDGALAFAGNIATHSLLHFDARGVHILEVTIDG